MRKFPLLSETFILHEMLALEARGVPLHVFSLGRPADALVHEDLSKLRASVSYIPDRSKLGTLLRHNFRALAQYRHHYAGALGYALRSGKPDLLWRFLQGGYVASEAGRLGLRHLHAHFATRPTSVAFLASMIANLPYSFTAHAVDIYKAQLDPKVLARKIDRARFVVTVSDFNRRHLERQANGRGDKVVRIYNGIDLDRFIPNGIPPRSPFTIISVARLVEKKGLSILIEACRHLRDRGLAFRCWVVGEGRLRRQLAALIEVWDLQTHVQLLGPQTQREVLERYRSAHVYALPCVVSSNGDRDGLPVSIVEALACGLPVVATPMTGIPEVVHDRRNGLLVPDRDPRALADALAALIHDRELYESLRANARTSVASAFDLGQTADALRSLFAGQRP